jgi:hypothetical protein
MRKLAMHVSRSDRIKRLFDGVEQPRKRSRLGASQSRCALRPTQLAGGESRRIGRQREVLCAALPQCGYARRADTTALHHCGWRVLAGFQGVDEAVTQVWEEGFMPLPLPHISWTGNGKPL